MISDIGTDTASKKSKVSGRAELHTAPTMREATVTAAITTAAAAKNVTATEEAVEEDVDDNIIGKYNLHRQMKISF